MVDRSFRVKLGDMHVILAGRSASIEEPEEEFRRLSSPGSFTFSLGGLRIVA